MTTYRHRKGVYQSDCHCPDCLCQREAILLGGNAARALKHAQEALSLNKADIKPGTFIYLSRIIGSAA